MQGLEAVDHFMVTVVALMGRGVMDLRVITPAAMDLKAAVVAAWAEAVKM
jgi:hypothetical protein